jgi:pyrimidine-nucleoside phosphorylase/thymidine phosphorylase
VRLESLGLDAGKPAEMRAVDILLKKRTGHSLTPSEIAWMVDGIASGDVADYQWSALLMAILWRGMDDAETAALTDAMMRSGRVVDLADIPGPKVDKHSTGGVGDKTSLILAPIAAACGVRVPMVSGRGLGHTGGTLDKLEAIPGFNINLNLDEFRSVLSRCGLVLIGQTAEIAPADKRLYALRDATATVESIPLITASILSKKLAEGIDGLVLDVKTGDGAFLPRLEDSTRLARTMVAIGRNLGKNVVALLTRMDQPLGRAVGNAVEVIESVDCLRGEGPADLVSLSVELAAEMVLLGGIEGTIAAARERCRQTIADGSALDRFRQVIEAQGGDARVLDDPGRLPAPKRRIKVPAPRDGIVTELRARAIGQATMLLGAGRARVESLIDPAVGLWLHKKMGDSVVTGEPLCTLLVNDESMLTAVQAMIEGAYSIEEGPATVPDLIVDRITE